MLILSVLISPLCTSLFVKPLLDWTYLALQAIDLLVVVVNGIEAARRHLTEAQLIFICSVHLLLIRSIIYHRACSALAATTEPEFVGHRGAARTSSCIGMPPRDAVRVN
jgi:hypothetical protein